MVRFCAGCWFGFNDLFVVSLLHLAVRVFSGGFRCFGFRLLGLVISWIACGFYVSVGLA